MRLVMFFDCIDHVWDSLFRHQTIARIQFQVLDHCSGGIICNFGDKSVVNDLGTEAIIEDIGILIVPLELDTQNSIVAKIYYNNLQLKRPSFLRGTLGRNPHQNEIHGNLIDEMSE